MSCKKQTGRQGRRQKIIELNALGYRQCDIARMIGCAVKYVNACLSEKQLESRKKAAIGYYAKVATGTKKNKRWLPEEDDLILTSTQTDTELAKELSRSIRAVHMRRYKLRHAN